MSKRKASNSAAASKRRFPAGLAGSVLLLALGWIGEPGDARADTIVLKSGEVVEGSVIEATRNTIIVQRAIGGMRQMSIRDIEEVRVELARGQQVSGELLSWSEGVYQVRSGGQVIRISEGAILSREPGAETTAQAPTEPPRRPVGIQTVRMAAAPTTAAAEEETAAGPARSAREQMAAQGSEGEKQRPAEQEQSPAAGGEQSLAADEDQRPADREQQSPAADENQTQAAAEEQSPAVSEDRSGAVQQDRSPPAAEPQRLAATEEQSSAAEQDQSRPADEQQSVATKQNQSPATDEEQKLAAIEEQSLATGEKRSLAIKASAEPGADAMIFRIELSRPAEQTVVLIYGTVEGTAKAGEHFEPQQGMVTIAPGTKSAEVRVPLIEQSAAQGEKRFELFLTADPKVAEVVDKRVIATINDDD